MFLSGGGEKTQLKILDRDHIKQVLDEIRSTKPGKVNWYETSCY
jgi:phage baseplate assembly protein W